MHRPHHTAQTNEFRARAAYAQLDGIDAGGALLALVGNEGLYRKMLGMFVEHHPRIRARFDAALAAADASALTREAHDLGGFAATLGMRELSVSCQLLEQACRNGMPLAQTAPLVEPLFSEFDRLAAQLRRTLA